jgi:hypothetical protein
MNWLDLLDVTQFSYNLQKSSMMGYSPFELMNGTTTHNSSFCDTRLLWDESISHGFCEELEGSVGDRKLLNHKEILDSTFFKSQI